MHYGLFDYERYGVAGFERIVAQQPGNVDAHFKLGLAYMDESRFEEAAATLRQALSLEASHSAAQVHLGRSLSELGRYADAVVELEQAIPGLYDLLQARPLAWLAEAYLGLEQPEPARDAFFRALAVDPHCIDAQRGLTQLSLCDVLMPRPENFAGPDVDTRLSYLGKGHFESECRVRIFRRNPNTVVLATSDDQCFGTPPILGAEDIYYAVIEQYQLEDVPIIWVFHMERGLLGSQDITRAEFEYTTLMRIGPQELRGVHAEFYPMKHAEFEKLTGFRIDWTDVNPPTE